MKGEPAVEHQFEDREIATTASGYLVERDDWSRDLAAHLARQDGIEMTERHWDVLDYLREEFFETTKHTQHPRHYQGHVRQMGRARRPEDAV